MRPLSPFFLSPAFLFGLWVAAWRAPEALADEIRHRDPNTCSVKTDKVAVIVAETWTEISAKSRATGPVDRKIPTRLVEEVVRPTEEDAQAGKFAEAIGDLRRLKYMEARDGFAALGGGGPRVGADGKATFDAFNKADSGGKPKWHSEYAHYYYAEAAWREAVKKNRDKEGLQNALRALTADNPAPKPDPADKEKKEPGVAEKGFLVRFKEGKSRFYGDAMLLKAKVLQDLGRYDEALKAYDELYAKAIDLPIGARFAYESKIGAGRVAEAKGSSADAETAYEAAATALEKLIATSPDNCTRRDFGRYYNEAGIQKARVLLEVAEKASSGPAFGRLQQYLTSRTPEALAGQMRGRPAEVVNAVVEGASVPSVQAVLQNGLGLSLLNQGKPTEAVLAFTEVRVKYFAEADEVPRALHYLAKAAAAAATAARGEAKALFEAQAAGARRELETAWADSPWAKRK